MSSVKNNLTCNLNDSTETKNLVGDTKTKSSESKTCATQDQPKVRRKRNTIEVPPNIAEY